MGIVDIHCHLLYGVDDGAKTIEESIAMLEYAKQQGEDTIILTPHYRHGMFAYNTELIKEHFEKLKPEAERIGIKLYLGCEYHVNSRILDYIDSGRTPTMASGDYVLCEYSYETEAGFILEWTENLLSAGFVPVIAHIERYKCMRKADLVKRLRSSGAMIQVNAAATLGKEGFSNKSFCKKMIKAGLVDIIASDSHGIEHRVNYMRECYDEVTKKYGTGVAERLFVKNPSKLVAHIAEY